MTVQNAQSLKLLEYFRDTKGTGILATSNHEGRLNLAVFSRPHVMADGRIAFIMRDRSTHKNLQVNPNAAYLFMEEGHEYKGRRLILTKMREEEDSELLYQLKRRKRSTLNRDDKGPLFLVFFDLIQELPLIGREE